MATDQMTWNTKEDWVQGDFDWTNTSNPAGGLAIGWPEDFRGVQLFVYRFAHSDGSTATNYADETQEATITGSYAWEETTSGVKYLSLTGGEVDIPTKTSWKVKDYILGCSFRVTDYPTSDMLLIGIGGSAGIYLTSSGYIKTPASGSRKEILGKKRVKKNSINTVNLFLASQDDSFKGIILFLNGEEAGRFVEAGVGIPSVSRQNFKIGPGNVALFGAWLTEKEDSVVDPPAAKGEWQSEIFDIGESRRLAAVKLSGVISKGHAVKGKVIMADDYYMAYATGFNFETNEATSFVVPNLVSGRYGVLALSLETRTPEDSPVITEAALYFSDYPFASPVHIPLSVIPESDIAVFVVPEQDDVLLSAGGLSGPKAVNIEAEETDAVVATETQDFKRVIRPRKGWAELGRLSSKNFISAHEVSPPIWYDSPLPTPEAILGQPLVAEDGTILAHSEGNWYAWDGFGKRLWFRDDPYPVIGDGTINEEILVWPTSADVRCADLRDGSTLWTYTPVAVPSGPASFMENGTILIPLVNGSVIFLSVDGALVKTIDSGIGEGFHLDVAYSDSPYSESYHSDTPGESSGHEDHSNHYNYTDSSHGDYAAGAHHSDAMVGDPPRYSKWGGEVHANTSCDVTGRPCDENTTFHGDVAHADVAHGDTAHSDTIHTDTPHYDLQTEEKDGIGVKFTDEGHEEEILLVFPVLAALITQDGDVRSYTYDETKLTAAIINDDVAQDCSTIRLIHAGFESGMLKTVAAESGGVLFERQLEDEVHFIVNVPQKGIPLLVGTETKLYLLQQNFESVWELDLDSPPAGWPVVSGEFIILALEEEVLAINLNGSVVTSIHPEETLTGSPVIMKPGTVLFPSEKGILVFKAANKAPFMDYLIWPETVHAKEQFYLVDRSSEIFGTIEQVGWVVKSEVLEGKVQKLSIDHPGTYEIRHLAANEFGQKSEEKIRLRVYPSFVEERPLVWEMEHQVRKHVWVLTNMEDDMRIFYPEEGISEVYQDQPVQIDLELFGGSRDITGCTVSFILKESESAAATTKLAVAGSLVEPAEGTARIQITAANWKTLTAGTFYWGIYVTYPSGLVELGGRGRLELRAALA